MKLVTIEWNDAHHHGPGEWVNPADLAIGQRVISTGFLLHAKRRHYTLVTSMDEGGLVTGVFSIPKACVRRYTVIAP